MRARAGGLVLGLVLGALAALGPAPAAAPGAGAEPQPRRWLTGRLLVATDLLRDPRFTRTVIFLARHDASGAFGLVINRPLARVPFAQALRPFGLVVPPDSGDVQVHYGGPVAERQGFVLHTPDWRGGRTTVVNGRFALSTDPQVLQAMAEGRGPRRALFLLGYAGWAPAQLEAELARGAWDTALADEALVFDEAPERKWERARARRLLDL